MRCYVAGLCAGGAVIAYATAAQAQTAATAATVDEVVVTGTRAAGRTALTSSSPVDVVTSQAIAATGYPDLASALETAEPSLNFPHAQTTPSSANTRPITLRGLSPDEVLVLVDGKRWHDTAVINTNFAVGRGTAPVDLSTIPEIAIDHVEILKDGASSQYGSDAIAGVVNIILKKNSTGGLGELQAGVTDAGDGATGLGAFNQGFPLGQGGHVSVSGEVLDQQPTDRSAIDQRYGRHTYRIGDPNALNANLAVTAAYPLPSIRSELYGDLMVSRKDSSAAVTFIAPGQSPLYPTGIAPEIAPVIYDVGDTAGLRGRLGGHVAYDLSNTFGYSDADFHVSRSANLALGAASPTSFDAGSERYAQDVTDLSFSRPFPGLLAGGNLAAGGQFRYESYAIGKGDAPSTYAAGSAGFPGLNPYDPVHASRTAEAVYVDGELKPAPWLTLGASGRYDRYSDFGGAPTGKGSFRLRVAPWLAFRGAYSTGFRAPSLQQEDYNSVTVQANGPNKSLVNVGTFPVADPVARALGATALRPETSHDSTLGLVLTPTRRLSITMDVFRIDIEHRIALSNTLSGATVSRILAANGIANVQQVAFFTNALNTRTEGFDAALNYDGEINARANYHLSLGFEDSPAKVRGVVANAVAPTLPLLSTHPILLLADAQPVNKLTGAFTVNYDRVSSTVDVVRYGHYIDAPISAPQTFSPNTVVNLSAAVHLTSSLTFTAGVLNLADVYPDKLQQIALAYPSFGNAFVYGEESPIGTAGRAYYLRLTLRR